MQDYRAYVLDQNGHVTQRHDFEFVDDEAAIIHARRFVDGHDVEVWQIDRVVKLLKSNE